MCESVGGRTSEGISERRLNFHTITGSWLLKLVTGRRPLSVGIFAPQEARDVIKLPLSGFPAVSTMRQEEPKRGEAHQIYARIVSPTHVLPA